MLKNHSSVFLPLRYALGATFNETRVPFSWKYVGEQGLIKSTSIFLLTLLHSYFRRKALAMLNFGIFCPFKGIFDAYLKWNVWTQFQIICISTGYWHFQLIRETLLFLVAFLRFTFRQIIQKSKYSKFFLSLKELLVTTLIETCTLTWRKYVSKLGISITDLSEKLRFFWSHSSVLALEK